MEAKASFVQEPSLISCWECTRNALPGSLEKAGMCSEFRTISPKLVPSVVFVPTQDAVPIHIDTRLLQICLAAVDHGFVERLEIFERRRGFVARGRAEVFVDALMCSAPSIGLLVA